MSEISRTSSTAPPGRRALRVLAVTAVLVVAFIAGAGVAQAHNQESRYNYYSNGSSCWEARAELHHPGSGATFDANAWNYRRSNCSGSGAIQYSDAHTLDNWGELWKQDFSMQCLSFAAQNSNPTYGFGVGAPSNCTNVVLIVGARAKDGTTWHCCGYPTELYHS